MVFAAALLAGGLTLPLGAHAHPEVRYSHGYHVGPFGAVHYVGPGHRCDYDHYYGHGHGKKYHKWAKKHYGKHHYRHHGGHGYHDRRYAHDYYRDHRHRRYDD